jgi:formylglycine-generating enzyme required for sulfatase activity
MNQTPDTPGTSDAPRLATLGFQVAFLNGAEVVLPPLCAVPAGPFLMGSDPGKDSDAYEGEKPQHSVTLPAFQIAEFPVTVAEYACFVRATGRAEPKGEYNQLTWAQQRGKRLDHPIVNVGWRDAVAYAQWLAERTNEQWRLPSEAEWEKTARWDAVTGAAHIYPWGDTFDASCCNTRESNKGVTTPVGSYPTGASSCGAQDMAGNVWEWTSSLFKPYPYTTTDGREQTDSTENRVLRGGSWFGSARLARAACRGNLRPALTFAFYGFRLARVVRPSESA